MRLLGSAASAATIVAALLAVPAQAAAPGYAATAQGDCTDGAGTIRLQQHQVSDDLTQVVVTGTDVADGQWVGGYEPDVENGVDERIEFELVAEDGAFLLELGVPGPPGAYPLVSMASVSGASCALGYEVVPGRFSVSTNQTTLQTWFPEAGVVAAGGLVFECTRGSRWRWTTQADFADFTKTVRRTDRVCRDGMVKLGKTVLSRGDVLPDAVRLVARGSDGDVRRLSWTVEGG